MRARYSDATYNGYEQVVQQWSSTNCPAVRNLLGHVLKRRIETYSHRIPEFVQSSPTSILARRGIKQGIETKNVLA